LIGGVYIVTKTDLFKILNRTQQLIELCDQKSGILLAIYGITIPLLINNNLIINKLIKLITNIQINFYSLLTIIILISLILSVYHIIQVFRARTDNNINDSNIYLKDISTKDYTTFKNSIENMKSYELKEDIINQIYVNSRICNKKYTHFGKALNCFVIFLIVYFLFYAFLLMGG